MKKNSITATELDKKFDDGEEDILQHFDVANPIFTQKRVNVDFPAWMLKRLDEEAAKLGLARQAVIKFYLAEKLGYSPDKSL